MDLKYKITFHSLWHCGSGESKGADLDNLVIKDERGLPFIPGKTIKGLVRDGMETLKEVQPGFINGASLLKLFGTEAKADESGFDTTTYKTSAVTFFTNAVLDGGLLDYLAVKTDLQEHLFVKIASTRINDTTGTAVDKSLRSIEATVPLELYGEIIGVPDEEADKIVMAMKMVKRMGTGRSRGLGRCTFEITEGGAK